VDAHPSEEAHCANSVVMFERGCNFPIVRRVTLKRQGTFTVDAMYDDSVVDFQFPKGASKSIATFTITAPPTDADCKIRVNVKQDIHGSLTLSSAQMVEEEPSNEGAADEESKKAAADEEPKKPKMKKTNLTCTISRPLEWTEAEIQREIEVEVAMANADRVIRETSDARNELESYIYDMRDKIVSDSQLAPYCTEEEKTTFSSSLQSFEDWLYDEGFDATKSVYVKQLNELKKLGDPIENRANESKHRSGAMTMLQKTLEKYTSWINSSQGDENYAHITDEERANCSSKCDTVSAWMYDILDKQGGLAVNVNPVVTVEEIYAKNKEVIDLVSPIMHKPKPKPKVEEKKEEETANEKKEEEEGETKPEPMDTSEPMEK